MKYLLEVHKNVALWNQHLLPRRFSFFDQCIYRICLEQIGCQVQVDTCQPIWFRVHFSIPANIQLN